MIMPGYNADASLYDTSRQYRMSAVHDVHGFQTKVLQQIWESACDSGLKECLDKCYLVDTVCVDACYADYYMCVLPPF